MKKISLFSLALLITFCLGTNLQAEEVQKSKLSSKTCMYVKRALGIGFGVCAVAVLEGAMFLSEDNPIEGNDVCLDKESYLGVALTKTVGAVVVWSANLKEGLTNQFGSKATIIKEVVPVALAAVLGLVSYKLLTSCDCSNEKEAEELAV